MEFSKEMCLVRGWSLPGEVPVLKMFIVENFGLITNKSILEVFRYETEMDDLKEQKDNIDGKTELVVKVIINRNDRSMLMRVFFNGKFVLENTQPSDKKTHMVECLHLLKILIHEDEEVEDFHNFKKYLDDYKDCYGNESKINCPN
jgi:hypothetical protein